MSKINIDIEPGARIYFYTPSETAKNMLYYPTVVGYHICGKDYHVHRKRLDNMLVMCVLDGVLALKQNGSTFTAERGEMLIVDCYTEHEYYAVGNAITIWAHFDGVNSLAWFREISEKKGQKLKTGSECIELITEIMNGIKADASEYVLSSLVYSLMCNISASSALDLTGNIAACVNKAKEYIKSNLQRDLKVAEIAEHVHFSASYFSRIFKETTGFSPYAFLLNSRIEKAKKLLIQTALPVSVIASETGFASEANFIYCFKQKLNISPLQFRKLKF